MTDHMKRTRPIPDDVAQLAFEGYYMELENGCRPTTYPKGENGYGWIKGYLVHRAAYTHVNGQIPTGLVIDHMCGTRSCVNPDHLRAITNRQNIQRQRGHDFPLDRGGCAWGHPESDMKVHHYPSRKRPRLLCQACLDENNRISTSIRTALHALELAYGLGGHETKKNYASQIAKRQERVEAVAEVRRRGEEQEAAA